MLVYCAAKLQTFIYLPKQSSKKLLQTLFLALFRQPKGFVTDGWHSPAGATVPSRSAPCTPPLRRPQLCLVDEVTLKVAVDGAAGGRRGELAEEAAHVATHIVVSRIVNHLAAYCQMEAAKLVEHNGVARLQHEPHLLDQSLYCGIHIGLGEGGVGAYTARQLARMHFFG